MAYNLIFNFKLKGEDKNNDKYCCKSIRATKYIKKE